jgi:hypothetical protein
MSNIRTPSQNERDLLRALLLQAQNADQLLREVEGVHVLEMSDGGMGSLTLVPEGVGQSNRRFGCQVVQGEFLDVDGVPVSVAVNLDEDGRLFELDVWKADFSPIREWPDPSSVRVVSRK